MGSPLINKDDSTEELLDRIADMIIDRFLEDNDLNKLTQRDKIKEGRLHEN